MINWDGGFLEDRTWIQWNRIRNNPLIEEVWIMRSRWMVLRSDSVLLARKELITCWSRNHMYWWCCNGRTQRLLFVGILWLVMHYWCWVLPGFGIMRIWRMWIPRENHMLWLFFVGSLSKRSLHLLNLRSLRKFSIFYIIPIPIKNQEKI